MAFSGTGEQGTIDLSSSGSQSTVDLVSKSGSSTIDLVSHGDSTIDLVSSGSSMEDLLRATLQDDTITLSEGGSPTKAESTFSIFDYLPAHLQTPSPVAHDVVRTSTNTEGQQGEATVPRPSVSPIPGTSQGEAPGTSPNPLSPADLAKVKAKVEKQCPMMSYLPNSDCGKLKKVRTDFQFQYQTPFVSL